MCYEEYIGESAKTFTERFKDHPKAPSPIYEHSNITDHPLLQFQCSGKRDTEPY